MRSSLTSIMLGIAAAAGVIVTILVAVGLAFPPWDGTAGARVSVGPARLSYENWVALQREGEVIVWLLRQAKERTGRFPDSLEELWGMPAGYCDWQYGVSEDGESCGLRIGDYSKHGFELYWSSRKGWYIDH